MIIETSQGAIYKPAVKYKFPSLLTQHGWYMTLDGSQKLIQPTYFKYTDGNGTNLSPEEKIYNLWVQEADKKLQRGDFKETERAQDDPRP